MAFHIHCEGLTLSGPHRILHTNHIIKVDTHKNIKCVVRDNRPCPSLSFSSAVGADVGADVGYGYTVSLNVGAIVL
jgi:hypothetical protein